jgi:hypothetical protein
VKSMRGFTETKRCTTGVPTSHIPSLKAFSGLSSMASVPVQCEEHAWFYRDKKVYDWCAHITHPLPQGFQWTLIDGTRACVKGVESTRGEVGADLRLQVWVQ